jgi:tetratricopeptide (TPR) repeat protein
MDGSGIERARRRRAPRALNVRLLNRILAVALVASLVGHFVHEFQLKRNASAFLRQADRAEEQGHLDQSALYLSRYLAYEPNDIDILARYGLTLEKIADAPKMRWTALAVLEQVVQKDPDRRTERRKLIDVAISLGQYGEAIKHLETLLPTSSPPHEIEQLLGVCQEMIGEYAKAAVSFEQASAHAPACLDSYVRLAQLYRRRLDRPDEADEVMNRLVQKNEASFEAHLLRALYRRENGALDGASRDITRACELAPKESRVLLAAAELAQLRGDFAEARRLLQQAIALHPDAERAYRLLAEVEVRSQRLDAALDAVRHGMRAAPNSLELLPLYGELLIDRDRTEEAAEVLARLRRTLSSTALTDYLDARLYMQQKRWTQAARLLEERCGSLAGAPPTLTARIYVALGDCYEQLGDPDMQREAYRRAVVHDGQFAPARAGYGAALLAADRLEEAAVELRQLVALPDAPDSSFTSLARVLYLRTLRLEPDKRDWREIEHHLERAARAPAEMPRVVALRADVLVAQGQPAAARVLLTDARDGAIEVAAYWIALAEFEERQGLWPVAAQTLHEAEHRLGDRPELRLALMRHWGRCGKPDALSSLARTEKKLESFGPDEQSRLQRALADAYAKAGSRWDAERVARQLAARLPHDLRSRSLLFDLALQVGREPAMEQAVTELRKVEGDDGALWKYADAARLTLLAQRGDRTRIPLARNQLNVVGKRRPNWPRVPLLEAALDELEGKLDHALTCYLRAVELGDVQPTIVARLGQLLFDRGRYRESGQVLRRLQERGELRGATARLATEAALRNRETDRALALAPLAVPWPPRNVRDFLWLADVFDAAEQRSSAEAMLRQAVEIRGGTPESWSALVAALHRWGRDPEAEAAVQAARKSVTKDQLPRVLARCYESLDQPDRARSLYQEALQASPRDLALLSETAAFYVRVGDGVHAEPLLRQLMDAGHDVPQDGIAWARRNLALTLATRGSDAECREALALLDRNEETYPRRVEDTRARALVLAARAATQPDAIRMLEESRVQRPLSATEQIRLSELYASVGDRTKARALLLDALVANSRDPHILVQGIETLLRWGETDEAGNWVEKLEHVAPSAPETKRLRTELGAH